MIPTRLFEFIEFQKNNLPLEKAFSQKMKALGRAYLPLISLTSQVQLAER